MKISSHEFAKDAAILCEAFGSLSNGCVEETGPPALVHWKLRKQGGSAYMIHPAVLRNVADTVVCDEDNTNAIELADDLVVDPVAHFTPSQQEQTTQWSFSIVYSETWMVPILYFTVKHGDNGVPYQRSQVLRMLDLKGNQVKDTWDFVSYEEHPITGEPSFFLHPCQSSDRLSLLLQQQSDQEASTTSPLLSWMNMILPAAGFRIPIKTFVQVQSKIADEKQAK